MRRSFRLGIFVAGGILLGPSVFFAALAQDDLQKSPDGVLGEAVVFAEALRSNESISKEEYKALVCSAMQDAVAGGMSPSGAADIGGISDCMTSMASAGEDGNVSAGDDGSDSASDDASDGDEADDSVGGSGGPGGHAPATPIVIPRTTAGSNDSTSPTSN